MTYDIGLVGLGVMGANLARNLGTKGFRVAAYDHDAATVQAFLNAPAQGVGFIGVDSPERLIEVIEKPRRILMMVPSGSAVDSLIAHLHPCLERNDILIDGGNSHFADTDRRCQELADVGIHFLGVGISGGEEGALRGPAIMPGGSREAWTALMPVFRAIAAKAEDGEPCVDYIGVRGAGHYAKMVHNGIEYADMQLIAETYDLLHRGAGLQAGELATVFAEWNRRELHSYLIEVTAKILSRVDDHGHPLIDSILDEAQQKGTGKWMSQNSLDIDAPIPTVNAAVDGRMLSALRAERLSASRILQGPSSKFSGDRGRLIDAASQALYASKITAYAQGFALLSRGSHQYGYGIDPGLVAKIWRAGCVVRAALLSDIRKAFSRRGNLVNLLLDEACSDATGRRQDAWRFVVQTAIGLGIPVPAMSASLAYYDAYRSERLPANLTQAQRDFFGAHTYRRLDRDGVFHTKWVVDDGPS